MGAMSLLPTDEFERCRGSAPSERATNYQQYDYYDFLKNPALRPDDPVAEQAFLDTIAKFGRNWLN